MTTYKRGCDLHPDDQRKVLDAFVHRWTHENARQTFGGQCPGCACPPVGQTPETWHHRHAPIVSDAEWLRDHSFKVKKDGRLSKRVMYAEPGWYAEVP